MAYRRSRRRRRGTRWTILPAIALTLFVPVLLLSRTGLDKKFEALIARGASDERLGPALLTFALGGLSQPDEPETPDEEKTLIPSEQLPPIESPPPGQVESPAVSASAQIALAESAAPELFAALPQNISAVTIDGEGSAYTGSGSVYIQNRSKYDIDIASLLKKSDGVKLSGSEVQVLIMHTHGTEAYTPDAQNVYTATDTDRTTDSRYNVVRVGKEIYDVLESRGIKAIHSKVLNDSPAYSGSYNRALEDISKQIKENPSIKVVIDVHRDAMETQNGTKYKTIAEVNGQTVSQLMFVAGTDGGGLVHDNWQSNLSFQLKMQDRLNTAYPGLMRPVTVRDERFNQHVTKGSMLLEVGTSGNSLPEALAAARLFANSLADELLSR